MPENLTDAGSNRSLAQQKTTMLQASLKESRHVAVHRLAANKCIQWIQQQRLLYEYIAAAAAADAAAAAAATAASAARFI